MTGTLRNAQRVDLGKAITANATKVRLTYSIEPGDAWMMIYASPASEPVKVSGQGSVEIALVEPPHIYVQTSKGARYDLGVNDYSI